MRGKQTRKRKANSYERANSQERSKLSREEQTLEREANSQEMGLVSLTGWVGRDTPKSRARPCPASRPITPLGHPKQHARPCPASRPHSPCPGGPHTPKPPSTALKSPGLGERRAALPGAALNSWRRRSDSGTAVEASAAASPLSPLSYGTGNGARRGASGREAGSLGGGISPVPAPCRRRAAVKGRVRNELEKL